MMECKRKVFFTAFFFLKADIGENRWMVTANISG